MQNLSVAHSSQQGVGAMVARALPAQHPPLNSAIGRNSSGHMDGAVEALSRVTQIGGPELGEGLGL